MNRPERPILSLGLLGLAEPLGTSIAAALRELRQPDGLRALRSPLRDHFVEAVPALPSLDEADLLERFDATALLIDPAAGLDAATLRRAFLAQHLNPNGVASLVGVVLDGLGRAADLRAAESRAREALCGVGLAGDDVPMRTAVWTPGAVTPDVTRALWDTLADVLDAHVPTPPPCHEDPARFAVDDVFSIRGRGTVAAGRLLRGAIRWNDAIELIDGRVVVLTRVVGVEIARTIREGVVARQRAGLLLKGVEREQVRRGAMLVAPGSSRPMAELRVRLIPFAQGRGALPDTCRLRLGPCTREATLLPAGEGVARVIPDAPLAAERGDRVSLWRGAQLLGAAVVL